MNDMRVCKAGRNISVNDVRVNNSKGLAVTRVSLIFRWAQCFCDLETQLFNWRCKREEIREIVNMLDGEFEDDFIE